MNIGGVIKKLRNENGMTQYQLADRLNVSMQTISRWETSATYPDIFILPLIAKQFSVTVDSLLGIGGNGMETIESNRLLIRDWAVEDAKDLFSAKKNPAIS
jgi:transcriptional regulator with XRE-family HTH domain